MSNRALSRSSLRLSSRSARNAALLLLAVAPAATLLPAARADNLTWDPAHTTTGSDADGNWNLSAANWANGAADVAWTNGNTAVFGVAAPANVTLSVTGLSAAGLTFNQGYTLTGSPLTLTGTPIITVNAGTATINAPLAGTAGLTLAGAAGTSLVLGGANTYSGGTVINGGTLVYNNDTNLAGSISFGPVVSNTSVGTAVGALVLNGNMTTTGFLTQNNNTLASPNTLSIAAGKTLTVNGPFTLGIPSLYTIPNAGTQTSLAISGDTMTVNGGNSNFTVGVARTNSASGTDPKVSLDLSNLTNFSYTGNGTVASLTGQFLVGAGNAQANLTLAVNNTITASQIRVGDTLADNSGSNDNNPNNNLPSSMLLGSGTNTLNTNLLAIGNDKGDGQVAFASSTGTLTIAGISGGASTADITVGRYQNGGSALSPVSGLNLAQHNVTIQAGTVTVGALAGGGSSNGTNGWGTLSFDTGTFTAANLTLGSITAGTIAAGANGTFTLGTDPSSTGVLNVTNSFSLSARTTTTSAGPAVGTFTINGGTANISCDIRNASTTTGSTPNTSTLNLNAGTLNINGHNIGSFDAPITNISLAGGNLSNAATIAGSNISISSSVNITGAPNFIIAGGGTLTSALSSLSISGAGSGIGGGGAAPATISGNVALGSGASLTLGNTITAGTLNFSNDLSLNNGSSASFKLGPTPGSGNDQVNVSGNLNLTGSIGLNILALGTGAAVGNTYTLFTYSGSLTGNQSNFNVAGAGARTTYTVLPTNTTPGSIQVSVGGSAALDLTYIGNVSSNWSLQGDSNFRDTSSNSQKFFNLDRVTFDDTSTNNNPVQISGNLQPGSVTVNASRNYTFAGSGAITGTIGLLKQGSGTLTITNNNSYSGGTDVEGGTLNVGGGTSAGSIGPGNVTINNSTLLLARTDSISFTNPITGNGNLTVAAGNATVSLGGANNFTGAVSLNSGITKIVNAASLGSTSGFPVTIANGATLDLGGDLVANDGAMNFQGRQFIVSGTGVNGLGAITNSGVSQQNAFNAIQLAGDTTFSGFRFDIGRNIAGNLDLAGHTLTLNMNAPAGSLFAILTNTLVTSGQIVVNSGGISIERNANIADDGTSTITYMPNTVAFFYEPNPANITRKMIFKGGNVIGAGDVTATVSAINSPISIQGDITLEPLINGIPSATSNFSLELQNNITESGGSFAVNKLGINTNILSGSASSWTGSGALSGTLEFAPNAASGTNNSTIGSYSGNGTLTIDPNVNINSGGLQINTLNVNGSLKIRNAATPSVSKVNTLALAGSTGAWTSPLDLTNSKLIIQDAANHSLTLATTRDQVAFAKSNANAAGIFDSVLPSNMGIAVLDNAVLNKSTFGGVNVDANSILVSQELLGDANADGKVDLTDLSTVLNHFGLTTNAWTDGNFDGAATINLTDLSDVLNNFGVSNPNGAAAAPASPTPEPTSLALLALAAPALLKRRKNA
ncbi:MAG: beta strand repeat-containing protein [Phycisphaerae bacterium]